MSQRQQPVLSQNISSENQTVVTRARLSAVNYYFLAAFVSATVFFVVWAILHDGFDDTPLIVAALSAGLCLISFAIVREIIGRRSQKREIAARRLSQHLKLVNGNHRNNGRDGKLTLKRNEELLREIRTKSEAAKILGKFADAHKEVFDLCEEYLTMATAELSITHAASPRVPAIRKGTISASRRHRFHMLRWAEIKARSFTEQTRTDGPLNLKIDAGEDALAAVESAIDVYPDESALTDSREVLRMYLTSAKVKISMAEAETAMDVKNPEQAVRHYEEALASLEKYDIESNERALIYDKIRSELSRIQKAG